MELSQTFLTKAIDYYNRVNALFQKDKIPVTLEWQGQKYFKIESELSSVNPNVFNLHENKLNQIWVIICSMTMMHATPLFVHIEIIAKNWLEGT